MSSKVSKFHQSWDKNRPIEFHDFLRGVFAEINLSGDLSCNFMTFFSRYVTVP